VAEFLVVTFRRLGRGLFGARSSLGAA